MVKMVAPMELALDDDGDQYTEWWAASGEDGHPYYDYSGRYLGGLIKTCFAVETDVLCVAA